MNKGKLEEAHRAELRAIAATTQRKYAYYKDVEIEDRIRPIVELLNSRWTVTLNSCGGHFEPGTPRFQYPYVHFAVLHRKMTAWSRIFKEVHRSLVPVVSDDTTLFVQTSYALPDAYPDIFIWRFCPYPYPGYSGHFESEEECWRTLDPFINRVVSIYTRATEVLVHRRS